MKRVFVLVAVIVGSGLFALSREAELALACSGLGPIENMLRANVIFEGRVISVVPDGAPEIDRAPHDVTFEVVRPFKGTKAGERVVANAKIPIPGKPIMCPQFPQDLAGKYVVIGLIPDDARPGELLADAWIMPFIGAEPGGEGYVEAVRLAEMIADSNPVSPQLLLQPAVLTCGQQMHLSGRQFPPGKYVLRYSGSARVIAVAEAGLNGAFDMDTAVVYEGCRNHYANGQPVAVHALDAAAGAATAWQSPDALVEIGFGPLAGAADGPFAELRVTPNPARCTDTLTIRGSSFMPGERLTVAVGEGRGDVQVTANSAGAFEASHGIPADACREGSIRVAATQAGFEAYTPPFLSIAAATLVRDVSPGPPAVPPGPPDVGTGSASAEPRGDDAWTEIGLVAVAVAVVGTIVLIFRRRVTH